MGSDGKSRTCGKSGLRLYIRTFGCQMNIRDSQVICGLLKAQEYELVEDPKKADIIIFNTCSVRQHAEDKVWSQVGWFAKKKKRVPSGLAPIIGIVGCMAKNYQEKIFERASNVDFVVGPSDIEKMPGIISELLKQKQSSLGKAPVFYERKIWETDGKVRAKEIYHTGYYEDKNHAYVVISEGCSNYCSYCVVPYVRGELHNRPHKDILREVEEALDSGINRFTLLGQNVNAYKAQIGFIELIKEINKIKSIKEFSFITSHPKDTTQELFKTMAECEKLKKYLHLPVQSGSDRILKLMNRNYTKKYYLDLISSYRRIVKGGDLTTDLIIGFPSETEDDFRQTYDLVEQAQFNSAFVFKYSPRPNTQAAKFADSVERKEKERRHALVLALQKEISRKK